MPSSAAAQMSPVPLESNSDGGSPQDRLNAEQAASMSFIDTSADTSTISIAPSNSPGPGKCSFPMVNNSVPKTKRLAHEGYNCPCADSSILKMELTPAMNVPALSLAPIANNPLSHTADVVVDGMSQLPAFSLEAAGWCMVDVGA